MAWLAIRLDFSRGGPVTRPREEGHYQQDCDQEGFTVVHDNYR
jgi:hypothetical protein